MGLCSIFKVESDFFIYSVFCFFLTFPGYHKSHITPSSSAYARSIWILYQKRIWAEFSSPCINLLGNNKASGADYVRFLCLFTEGATSSNVSWRNYMSSLVRDLSSVEFCNSFVSLDLQRWMYFSFFFVTPFHCACSLVILSPVTPFHCTDLSDCYSMQLWFFAVNEMHELLAWVFLLLTADDRTPYLLESA